jgi:hypothetical protein
LARKNEAEQAFLERMAITSADQACDLFTAGERAALRSGLYQAEGALLRADYDPATMRTLGAKVSRHASGLGCRHPAITEAAERVRSSFREYQKISFQTFPGRRAAWQASRSRHDNWALRQDDTATGAVFGLRRLGAERRTYAVIALPAASAPPAGVRLWIRDANKRSAPWLGGLGRDDVPLPRSLAAPLIASARTTASDTSTDVFHLFQFPGAALERLKAMDPRERVEIEIEPPGRAGDVAPRRIWFEVGDVRAALAFLEIPDAAPAETAG